MWEDGSEVTFREFGFEQPDDYIGTEDCVVHRLGLSDWNDVPCTFQQPYICKFPRGTCVFLCTLYVLPYFSFKDSIEEITF